ncbi:MAG: hypothetical protein AB8I08_35075 [Sandaracinaceae bacterium]
MVRPLLAFVLAPFLALPSLASAQGSGGVANSGMGQGEARISSRSDVRLSMESMPGTGGSSMSALGTRVGARMATIRGCYETVVAEHPTVTGRLRMRVLLEDGHPGAAVEVDEDAVNDAGLVRCVTEALESIDCSRLRRPTRAIVQLEMGNTAAAGARVARARAQEARQVSITIDSDGNASSTGNAPGRGVAFTVTGEGRESVPAVTAAHRAVLTSIPGLLDCHRRASRRGQSPVGEIRARMVIREGRPPVSRVSRSTVEESRTRPCINRVLRGIQQRTDEGRGNVELRIQFTEAAPVAN